MKKRLLLSGATPKWKACPRMQNKRGPRTTVLTYIEALSDLLMYEVELSTYIEISLNMKALKIRSHDPGPPRNHSHGQSPTIHAFSACT